MRDRRVSFDYLVIAELWLLLVETRTLDAGVVVSEVNLDSDGVATRDPVNNTGLIIDRASLGSDENKIKWRRGGCRASRSQPRESQDKEGLEGLRKWRSRETRLMWLATADDAPNRSLYLSAQEPNPYDAANPFRHSQALRDLYGSVLEESDEHEKTYGS